jgi:Glutathione S-transferase
MMKPVLSAFACSPDCGRGFARDHRVRWALEELGQPYEVRLLSFEDLKASKHRALHPFGQIPTYEEGDISLFESGAIVLYLAERHHGLLPTESLARSRAIMWMFAALNTMEPPIVELSIADIVERDKTWHAERRPMLEQGVRRRLRELADWLGSRLWLENEFSVGDLMMVSVLRRTPNELLAEQPALAAYVARGEARPAFQRALAAQRAEFERSSITS